MNSYIKAQMQRHNFRTKKSLGQNFLADENYLQKIGDAAGLQNGQTVIEIGPGMGVLTKVLAQRVGGSGQVLAVEVDKALEPFLLELKKQYPQISIVWEDALKINFDQLVMDHTACNKERYTIAANLPYYITTPILMHLLENRFRVKRLVVMIQKEVADRITANPGNKDYGALTVAVQYYTSPSLVTTVPPEAFIPQPKVFSAVVCLDILDEPSISVKDESIFFRVVKGAFAQRRKTLINSLASDTALIESLGGKASMANLLLRLGIDGSRRGETLSLQEMAAIADGVVEQGDA